MNNCSFVGRLTRDVELAYAASGTAVAKFGLAIDRGKDKPSDFFDFTAFGKTAEFVSNYFSKGKVIGVSSQAQLDQWETDGQKRSKVCFIVNNVTFVPSDSKKSNSNAPETAESATPAESAPSDDIPF